MEQSDWFVLVSAQLVKLVFLSMILERGLYFIFDYSLWRERIERKGIRAPVSLAAAGSIVYYYDFDILVPTLDPGAGSTFFGLCITALIVAGGSAGAIKLFQDFLGLGRKAQETTKINRETDNLEAKTKFENAKNQALTAGVTIPDK